VELSVVIEKTNDDIVIPMGSTNDLQIRSDGVLLDGELHLWEEIMTVNIVNRELLNKLKNEKT